MSSPPERQGAVAYIRTSTARQDLSPDAQREAIRVWAERRKIEIISWHEDRGTKGASEPETRAVLVAALASVKRKRAKYLVAARLDRFARSVMVTDKIRLLSAGAGGLVVCADGSLGEGGDDPMTTMLLQIQAAVAQFEAAVIRHRIRAALDTKRRGGRRMGSVPLGWQLRAACSCKTPCPERKLKSGEIAVCERLEPNKIERRAGKLAARLRGQGSSLREIGEALRSKGYEPRGKSWHKQTVKALLAACAQW